ncbi:MAG: glutamate--tRNA ligase, partial [Thermoplasmata archaeon]|nr:glutamate--tRNA ligase [Thermoplasmata archaeon]
MREKIRSLAAKNALKHHGTASVKAVLGMVFSAMPEAKEDPGEIKKLVEEVVKEINSLPPDELQKLAESAGRDEKREKKEGVLPPLEDAVVGDVVLRFAPGPSGPLHLGHSRAAILNDEYARLYKGKFILRLEDTNPRRIDPEAYRMIPEDLKWLGVEVHETYVQSDRMEIYYDVARQLIEAGAAYVCTCPVEKWRELKVKGKACPHRELAPEVHLEKWEEMLDGRYGENEATLVVKTDLKHPNPAVRDFPAFRIVEHPHPRLGDRYSVYPLYNFSVAVDDHLMGCTHILRGKDHLNNTLKQEFIYKHMGWNLPRFIHYGLVSIPEAILKTSTIKEEIKRGIYTGWDDVRLGTLRALKKRGINAEAIRRFWLQVGVKPVDITMSFKTLYSINRDIIDDTSNRYFFVESPRELFLYHSNPLKSSSPLHPNHPERGRREYHLKPSPLPGGFGSVIYMPEKILKALKPGDVFRLKDLVNVEYLGERGGVFSGRAVGGGAKDMRGRIFQWCPPHS